MHYTAASLKPAERLKVDGLSSVLLDAVRHHAQAIHTLLAHDAHHPLEMFFDTGDFLGQTWTELLPLLAYTTSAHSNTLPVPDWTFANASLGITTPNVPWEELRRALLAQAARSDPPKRVPLVQWRGTLHEPSWVHELPSEQRARRSLAVRTFKRLNHTLVSTLGIASDVHFASDSPSHPAHLTWPSACNARYQLHVDGIAAYSLALKYRLTCGAVVLRVPGVSVVGNHIEPQREWWEAAVPPTAGVEYEQLDPTLNASKLLATLRRLEADDGAHARRVGRAAAEYAAEQLSPAAVRCYWRSLLVEYASLHARVRRACADARHPKVVGPRATHLPNVSVVVGASRNRLCSPVGRDAACYQSVDAAKPSTLPNGSAALALTTLAFEVAIVAQRGRP